MNVFVTISVHRRCETTILCSCLLDDHLYTRSHLSTIHSVASPSKLQLMGWIIANENITSKLHLCT